MSHLFQVTFIMLRCSNKSYSIQGLSESYMCEHILRFKTQYGLWLYCIPKKEYEVNKVTRSSYKYSKCYELRQLFLAIMDQTSANNSTLSRYLSKTRSFGNYLCMNLWKSRPSYSTRLQSFGIRLDDESQVATLLRRNLLYTQD